MAPRAASSRPQPLNTQRVTETLEQFAGSAAVWWLQSWLQTDGRGQVQAELVVAQDGQELGRWPVHLMTYGGVIRRLTHQPEDYYAIPLAPGMDYDKPTVTDALKAEARQLLRELCPPLNSLLRCRHLLEDGGGLDEVATKSWLLRSKEVERLSEWANLWKVLLEVGNPHYRAHYSYLAEIVERGRLGHAALKAFLADFPLASLSTADPKAVAATSVARRRTSKRYWYTCITYFPGGQMVGYSDPGNSEENVFDDGTGPYVRARLTINQIQPFYDTEAPEEDAYGPEEQQMQETPRELPYDELREELLQIRQLVDKLLERIGQSPSRGK
jgi:hypothetical protein